MNIESKVNTSLWIAIKSNYTLENYTGAILDSIYYIAELIRDKSGLETDGVSLIGQAFGGNNPKIRVNKLQSETEKNIQKGICSILIGLFQSVRNPRSHEKYNDCQHDADAIILFINYLYTIIEDSKTLFSEVDFMDRVFDLNFVESDHYANLIVMEIPFRKRYDILVRVFKMRTKGDCTKLKYFFSALLEKISIEELNDFYDIVSDELKTESKEIAIRSVIQLLPIENWMMLSEVTRLRVENIILNSIKEGEYHYKCIKGSLGTWVNDGKINYFTIKKEFMETLYQKLSSFDDDDAINYVITYFWNDVSKIVNDKFDNRFVKSIHSQLECGSIPIYEALSNLVDLENKKSIWTKEFGEKYKNFEPYEYVLPF